MPLNRTARCTPLRTAALAGAVLAGLQAAPAWANPQADADRLRTRSLAATCAQCHGTDGHAVAGQAIDPILAASHLLVHQSVAESGFIEEMREWAPDSLARDDGLDAVSGAILEQPVMVGSRRFANAAARQPGGSGFLAETEFAL